MMIEIVSLVLNLLLGGGLLVTLVTLRSTRTRAAAEAARASVETDEKASQVLMTYIVQPLKNEINGLRKDVRMLKRIIEKFNDCGYSYDCPVKRELQNNTESDRHDD